MSKCKEHHKRFEKHLPPRPQVLRFSGLALWIATSAAAQESLSLHDAIRKAMLGPAVQIVDAQTEEVRGGVRQAGLRPNPRLYLQSEDFRPWADDFSFATQTEDYGYIGQTLELGGKRSKRVAFAESRLHQAEALRTLQLRQLAGRVAAAYWNAVSLQRVAELLREDMGAVDEMVRYHKARVDAGAMRGVDLLRMEIERDRLNLALATADRDAAQARLELFRQMGIAPTDAKLSDHIEDAPLVAPLSTESAMGQRPDVQAAREAVVVAEADMRLQKANGVPDPDLLAGYKRNAADNTGYASLQIPLPFRNRNQGEVERAHSSITAAEASLSLLETQVQIEISQARQNYEVQGRTVHDTLPEMRSRAKQNLQIVAEAYRIGGIDLLRFIDAERTEFDVQVSSVRTLAQFQQSAVQLQLAYGVQP